MSAPNQPPPYENHGTYQTQPTQYFHQPPIMMPPPQNQSFQPVAPVTVITQQPTNVVISTTPILGPLSVAMTCSNCYAYITTSTSHEISLRTHCCALGLCLVGLWPCAIFPYVCGGCCQRTIHTCPNCNKFLGSD